jgi:N-sulfoglucosamine sulfohydrolase
MSCSPTGQPPALSSIWLRAAALTATLASASAAESAVRSVVVISADDLGLQLGCYGDRTVPTPRIDALAASGTQFTRAYVTKPSCSPSRAALYTGLYPHQNGHLGLSTKGFALLRAMPTLPALLCAEGRVGGFFGKLHVEPAAAFTAGFTSIERDPMLRDPSVVRRRTREFLAMARGKPFVLHWDLFDPHQPFADQAHGLPKKPLAQGSVKPWSWTELPANKRDEITAAEAPHSYYNGVARLDSLVGAILDELDAAKAREHTLIVFWGDNGPPTPRGKANLYENGVHVPLIISGPDVQAGQKRDELVSTIDVLPTVCAAAGVTAPSGPNYLGRDLGPLLRGETPAWRSQVFTEMTFHTNVIFRPLRAVHEARWKLLRTLAVEPAGVKEELYDLAADPDERRDLAADPAHAAERTRLAQALDAWQRETADPLLDAALFTRLEAIPKAVQTAVPPWYTHEAKGRGKQKNAE